MFPKVIHPEQVKLPHKRQHMHRSHPDGCVDGRLDLSVSDGLPLVQTLELVLRLFGWSPSTRQHKQNTRHEKISMSLPRQEAARTPSNQDTRDKQPTKSKTARQYIKSTNLTELGLSTDRAISSPIVAFVALYMCKANCFFGW